MPCQNTFESWAPCCEIICICIYMHRTCIWYVLQILKQAIIRGVLLRVNWGKAKAHELERQMCLGSLFFTLAVGRYSKSHSFQYNIAWTCPKVFESNTEMLFTGQKCTAEERVLNTVTLKNLNSPQLASGRNSLIFLQLDIVAFLKKVDVDEMINFIIYTNTHSGWKLWQWQHCIAVLCDLVKIRCFICWCWKLGQTPPL